MYYTIHYTCYTNILIYSSVCGSLAGMVHPSFGQVMYFIFSVELLFFAVVVVAINVYLKIITQMNMLSNPSD